MENNIGKIIGVVEHTFSTKLDTGERVQLTVKFDFSSSEDDEIKQWLVSNRVIALQRPLRTLTSDEAKGLDGQTLLASTCGQKIESKGVQIKKLIIMGIPRPLAEMVVENPDKLTEVLNNLGM